MQRVSFRIKKLAFVISTVVLACINSGPVAFAQQAPLQLPTYAIRGADVERLKSIRVMFDDCCKGRLSEQAECAGCDNVTVYANLESSQWCLSYTLKHADTPFQSKESRDPVPQPRPGWGYIQMPCQKNLDVAWQKLKEHLGDFILCHDRGWHNNLGQQCCGYVEKQQNPLDGKR
jgi:hypothetical protein